MVTYKNEEHLLIIGISSDPYNMIEAKGPLDALALSDANPSVPGSKTMIVQLIVFQDAFESFAHLYHVIGHEGVHIGDHIEELKLDYYAMEARAYKWNIIHMGYVPYPWDVIQLLNKYHMLSGTYMSPIYLPV